MILRLTGIITALCSLGLPAWAQANPWLDVEKLGPGTPISVVQRARQECELVAATDLELTCDRDIAGQTRRLVFVRDRVEEVRLEMPQHNRMIPGAIIGAIAGGLIGLVAGQQPSDPEARVYARIYGIPMGAVIGGVIGRYIHRHGAVIFRK